MNSLKKCPKCKMHMVRQMEDTPINSQTDETERNYVWYCVSCNKVYDMTEQEQIQSSIILKEEKHGN